MADEKEVPTPRTDKYLRAETGIDFNSRMAQFVRTLERELIHLRAAKEAAEVETVAVKAERQEALELLAKERLAKHAAQEARQEAEMLRRDVEDVRAQLSGWAEGLQVREDGTYMLTWTAEQVALVEKRVAEFRAKLKLLPSVDESLDRGRA